MKRAFIISGIVVCSILSIAAFLQASGIVPAIVPSAVPSANRRGTLTGCGGSGCFALASSAAAGSSGAAYCDDGSGNLTTSGCTTNAVTSTSPVTANANSTADQQLMELSLSAGYLNSLGRPFDFFGAGVYTTQAGQTPTLEFKIKLCTVSGCGSGTVVTLVDITTSATTANSPNVSWNLRALAATSATGATGNLEIHGNATVDLGNLISTSDTIFTDTNTAVSGNIDLTAALFVDFTIKFSTQPGTPFNAMTQREGVVSPGGSTSGGGGGGGANITQGTFASLPGTCTTNDVYFQTDGAYLFRCSATNTFSAFLQDWGLVTVPPSAGWTSDNVSTGTYDSTNGYRYATALPTGGGTDQLRGQFRTAPATPYAVTMGIRHRVTDFPSGTINEAGGYGVGFRDGTGKILFFMAFYNVGGSSNNLEIDNWTNSTTVGANQWTTGYSTTFSNGQNYAEVFPRDPAWFCIADDGTTNVTFSWSIDRRHWKQILQQSRTNFFGSGPTQIFWGAEVKSAAQDEALVDYTTSASTTCQ